MSALLVSLLLASAPARAWSPPDDASLDALLRAVQGRPIAERIARISGRFLGAPYQLGPLGEGPGQRPDPDPLWRWDAVDCVTFVEQVLALAECRTAAEAERTLQEIRYSGSSVDFADRNHLMESEWIPNNARKGFVRPETREIAGGDARFIWRREREPGEVRDIALPYLPLGRALAHEKEIPSGTIFFVARQWWHRVPDHVTHVGLLVRRDGRLYARHASSARGRVVDEPFARFLREEQRSMPRWPVLGLELVEPLQR